MVKLPRISHSSSTSPHKNTRRSLKDEDSEGKLTAAAFGVYKTNLEPIARNAQFIQNITSIKGEKSQVSPK